MNKAKLVMFIFAIAGMLSMLTIGYAIAAKTILGTIVALIALCIVMILGFKTKRKFREQGLL